MIDTIIAERIKKRDAFIKAGYDPYPAKVEKSHQIGCVLKLFYLYQILRKSVTIAGRITGKRVQGGVMFLDIRDDSGEMQAVFNKKAVYDFKLLAENIDIGDFIGVSGVPFKTRKGEKSINTAKWQLATKTLRPLPSQWYGLQNEEEKLRKRYLDILLNPENKGFDRKEGEILECNKEFSD